MGFQDECVDTDREKPTLRRQVFSREGPELLGGGKAAQEGPGPQSALLGGWKNSETRLSWGCTAQAPGPSLSFLESWASVHVGIEICGLISVVTGDQRTASCPVRVLVELGPPATCGFTEDCVPGTGRVAQAHCPHSSVSLREPAASQAEEAAKVPTSRAHSLGQRADSGMS